MIDSLRFAHGAVATKDLIPALTHFRIKDGTIKGFNGTLALCAPIALDLDIAPNAKQLIRAVDACTGTVALHLAGNGKLCVRSDNFQAFVDCVDASSYPEIMPKGQMAPVGPGFLDAIRYLAPFIGTDASRAWACGILFDGQTAQATNNIVMVQYWLQEAFPLRVNVPSAAIAELLRINEAPASLQIDESRLCFHYPNGSWLSTQLFDPKWPDIESIFKANEGGEQVAFPIGIFEALERLAPFCEDPRFFFKGDRISSHAQDEEVGAGIAIVGVPSSGCFNINHFLKLKEIAKSIDLGNYPKPCLFYGEMVRGCIVGYRV